MEKSAVDILWVLLSAGLVFLMQAGFLSLETGLTRTKNSINVAVKNLADFAITTVLFWAVGFGIMFGLSRGGWIGASEFFMALESQPTWIVVFFIYQVMFCGTAVTILSGGAAERLRFGGYLLITALVSALIYPFFGHWAWNGLPLDAATGWLNSRGFVDFAGSTVVHSVGGWVTLATILILGPRIGRFNQDHTVRKLPATNIPFAALGVLLLWVGWIGFNGGSTLALNDSVAFVIANTMLAGSAGMVASLVAARLVQNVVSVESVLNGALAGLVAITAGAHVMNTATAVFVGAIGGVIAYGLELLLLHFHIDDAVGAVPVHLGPGIWGTLAVGLFGQLDLINTGLSRGEQIGIQAVGILICFVWTFGIAFTVLQLVNRVFPLRVTTEAETVGLNVSEHNAGSELFEMISMMDTQVKTGDLTMRAPAEPFTYIGQIGERYNRVMASLEQAVARNEAIVTTARDGIITISQKTGRIETVNPAAAEIFGYTPQILVGQPATALFSVRGERGNGRQNGRFDSLIGTHRYHEVVGKRADGSQFPLEMAITEVRLGEAPFYAALLRDITVRKQTLERLDQARLQALEASNVKSQFLAIVSHELRTPLNAIVGLAELIDADIYGQLNEKQRSVVHRIIQSSDHLTQIVNDLLDQAQLEAGTLKLQTTPFSPAELLEYAQFTLGVLATAKGVSFESELDSDLPPVIVGDPGRLKQIVTNLVGNAVKFTDEGEVAIRFGLAENGRWAITVRDTGPGIDEESLPHIFDAFRQAETAEARRYGGAGLGLSIAQQLTKRMGGDINAQSQLGVGTTIQITLPLEVATTGEPI